MKKDTCFFFSSRNWLFEKKKNRKIIDFGKREDEDMKLEEKDGRRKDAKKEAWIGEISFSAVHCGHHFNKARLGDYFKSCITCVMGRQNRKLKNTSHKMSQETEKL